MGRWVGVYVYVVVMGTTQEGLLATACKRYMIRDARGMPHPLTTHALSHKSVSQAGRTKHHKHSTAGLDVWYKVKIVVSVFLHGPNFSNQDQLMWPGNWLDRL